MIYNSVLIISDTHLPFAVPELIPFLKLLKKKYKPDRVIHIGDEVDKHAMSFHDSDPDLPSAGDELRISLPLIKELEKLISNPALNTLISKGPAGASYNQEFSKAPRINTVNSNGAGDALLGAFLAYFGIIDEKDALKKAVSYAAEICTVNGPRLDI